MSDAVTYNENLHRYEMTLQDGTVFARVRRKENLLMIDHVESPASLRGQGAGSNFMKSFMDVVRRDNLKVTPVCSFAKTWLNKHADQYRDLVQP
jgi:predicted GNAT family acetyltransferase